MVVPCHGRGRAQDGECDGAISVLKLTAEEEAELDRRVCAPTTARWAHRAAARQGDEAEGRGAGGGPVNDDSEQAVAALRAAGAGRPGRGAKPSISPAVVEEVVAKAGREAPGMRRRSTRVTAAEVGISASSVLVNRRSPRCVSGKGGGLIRLHSNTVGWT